MVACKSSSRQKRKSSYLTHIMWKRKAIPISRTTIRTSGNRYSANFTTRMRRTHSYCFEILERRWLIDPPGREEFTLRRRLPSFEVQLSVGRLHEVRFIFPA